MTNNYNPNTREAEQHTFRASLSYIAGLCLNLKKKVENSETHALKDVPMIFFLKKLLILVYDGKGRT